MGKKKKSHKQSILDQISVSLTKEDLKRFWNSREVLKEDISRIKRDMVGIATG